jgi:predicted anti-sigma-YlaC factor YlaD
MNTSQPTHPDRLRLEAYVDGTAARGEARVVAEHVEQCSECAGYVQRIRSLDEALRGLPTTARKIPPFEKVIASRTAWRPHREQWMNRSPLAVAAAATLIFTAGLAAGIATTRPASGEAPYAPTHLRPTLEVQRAGTSYIAALVELNASTRGDEPDVAYGREVALATLYGAAAEAVVSLGSDPAASELLALARAVRERAAQPFSPPRAP